MRREIRSGSKLQFLGALFEEYCEALEKSPGLCAACGRPICGRFHLEAATLGAAKRQQLASGPYHAVTLIVVPICQRCLEDQDSFERQLTQLLRDLAAGERQDFELVDCGGPPGGFLIRKPAGQSPDPNVSGGGG